MNWRGSSGPPAYPLAFSNLTSVSRRAVLQPDGVPQDQPTCGVVSRETLTGRLVAAAEGLKDASGSGIRH